MARSNAPIIDFDKQEALKDHIDDLVFALYFNIDIPSRSVSKPHVVKKLCQKNNYYKQVQR